MNGGLADALGQTGQNPDVTITAKERKEEIRRPKSDVDFRKQLEELGFDVEKSERKARTENLISDRDQKSDKLS